MTVAEIFDHVERKFNVREKQEAQQRFPQRIQREEIWQREVKELGNVNEGGEPPKGGDVGAKRTNKTRGRSATRAASPPSSPKPALQLPPPPSQPPPPLPKPQYTPQISIPQGNCWGKGFVPQKIFGKKDLGRTISVDLNFRLLERVEKGMEKEIFQEILEKEMAHS